MICNGAKIKLLQCAKKTNKTINKNNYRDLRNLNSYSAVEKQKSRKIVQLKDKKCAK